MANDNESGYLKGAKQNPYTLEEYRSMRDSNMWNGGWIYYNGLAYASSDGVNIIHNSPEILGSRNRPIAWNLYQEMKDAGYDVWSGGWVVSENPSDGLSYIIDSWGTPQYDNNGNLLGSIINPVSQEIFRNMCQNGIWEGGYIYYYDNLGHLEKYYASREELYRPNAGSGSGSDSGCGSGCGSGSGSDDGSEGGNGSGGTITSSGSQVVGGDGDVTISFYWKPSTGVTFKAGYEITPHPSGNRQLNKIEESTLSFSYNGNKVFTLDGNISVSYTEIDPTTNMLIDAGVVRVGLQTSYVTIP